MMKDEFKHHLRNQLKILPQSRVLVAVSGGMDSVALLHLLINEENDIGVAHANFGLRGDESDRDENFVRKLAKQNGLPIYSKHFDTKGFADVEGISIQMAARMLRYDWFGELAAEHRWDYVATAHNLDDQIETFFINLLRGTGIGGLKGIPAKSGLVIRPLLHFYRSEIEEYVKNNRLDYREDSSNFKTDYLRNRIRHHLMPLLDEMQPAFRKVMAGNLSHLASAEAFFREGISNFVPGIMNTTEDGYLISIPRLLETSHPELLLHEILRKYGFSTAQTQQIFQAIDSQPGKMFCTETHRLIKDREQFILQTLAEPGSNETGKVVEEDTCEIFSPLHMQFQTLARDMDFHPTADPDKAFLDFDTLRFPLKIRKWKHGDRFKPLGMKGQVKLSDYFVANKFSIAEKEKTWLLTDALDQIIWIIRYRIADQNRIKPATKTVYSITCLY